MNDEKKTRQSERERRRRLKQEVKTKLREGGRDRDPLAEKARLLFLGKSVAEIGTRFLEDLEKKDEHGAFVAAGVVGLVKNAFETLRDRLEDPEAKDVTWEDPFLEVRYPVNFHPDHGVLPAEDLVFEREDVTDKAWAELRRSAAEKDAPAAPLAEKLGELVFGCLEVGLFASLTNGAFFVKEGNEYTGGVLKDYWPEPREGASPEELEAAFGELSRPFIFSGREDAALKLSGINDAGEAFSASVVVEVHPLILDVDEEEAFYPVIVGLAFEGVGGKPSAWPEEDRQALWEKLLEALDELAEKVRKGEEPEPEALVPALPPPSTVTPPPERRYSGTFPLSFGRALGDVKTLDFLSHLHAVRLPAKRWSTLKSWEELEAAEVQRIKDEEGDAAFEDLRDTTGNQKARGPLLKRRFRRGGQEEVVELTAEAAKRLKVHAGLGTGYRQRDPETGAEYLVRLFQLGSGFLEVGLSWYGLAGPWVEEWTRLRREEASGAVQGLGQGLLFEELGERQRERVGFLVRRFQGLEDGRKIMEMALGQVGRQARNPVRVPAVVFRELLGLQTDKDWRARIRAGLNALRFCSFRMGSFDTEKLEGYGSFLSSWWYQGAGPGAHGEGDYFLHVEPLFIGCLAVFESGRRRLSSRAELIQYDFGRKPTAEDKQRFGWGRDERGRGSASSTFAGFDAGRVFYNDKAGLSEAQKSLVAFLERELTLRKDAASRILGDHKARKAAQATPRAQDANEPRLYGRDFCPLLPEGKLFHAALGHFRKNPETGRSLYGTRTRSTATGGPHTDGLLSVLGYYLPPGRARAERGHLVRQALEDLQAVVVDYLGGVVAARGPGGRWLTLEEAAKLPEPDLGRKTKWFLFLPETWGEDRKRKWEEATGWKATEDPVEADRARAALLERTLDVPRGETGLVLLRHRLRAARLDRNLRLEDVGKLFGVSKMAVSKWEVGTDTDEEGRVRGKPIPHELVQLVVRWIETGKPPTAEELSSRKTRRPGGLGGKPPAPGSRGSVNLPLRGRGRR